MSEEPKNGPPEAPRNPAILDLTESAHEGMADERILIATVDHIAAEVLDPLYKFSRDNRVAILSVIPTSEFPTAIPSDAIRERIQEDVEAVRALVLPTHLPSIVRQLIDDEVRKHLDGWTTPMLLAFDGQKEKTNEVNKLTREAKGRLTRLLVSYFGSEQQGQ